MPSRLMMKRKPHERCMQHGEAGGDRPGHGRAGGDRPGHAEAGGDVPGRERPAALSVASCWHAPGPHMMPTGRGLAARGPSGPGLHGQPAASFSAARHVPVDALRPRRAFCANML